ncbi:vascular endothelial growth factor A-like isoform X5 [Pristis pectinata]|uniref:vascular endothelial growth factor A-like isoform X5 n=1 Tax=Pristis pectinata TaxID=685728 RepID=UPI00223D1FD3|nr:vascular endothelial growth factor A-like isoform X5 [Pristis pectinata]
MDLPSALTILHFQLALFLLRSALAKVPIRRSTPSPIPREARQQANQAVTWMDVYWRSVCQTRETLVAISGEYPNEVEYIFVPSCVLLSRCSGCCNDEQLQCVPTDTDTVLMQILKVKHRSSHLEEMSFVQHRRCECRPKKEIKRVPERTPCSPCSSKRRHHFEQNPLTCECKCRLSHSKCRQRGQELNEHMCRCEKQRR